MINTIITSIKPSEWDEETKVIYLSHLWLSLFYLQLAFIEHHILDCSRLPDSRPLYI